MRACVRACAYVCVKFSFSYKIVHANNNTWNFLKYNMCRSESFCPPLARVAKSFFFVLQPTCSFRYYHLFAWAAPRINYCFVFGFYSLGHVSHLIFPKEENKVLNAICLEFMAVSVIAVVSTPLLGNVCLKAWRQDSRQPSIKKPCKTSIHWFYLIRIAFHQASFVFVFHITF